MKVVVTGASGLIGRETMSLLRKNGLTGIGLSRNANNSFCVPTDYSVESLTRIFRQCDVIVHLAAKRGGHEKYYKYWENEQLTENVLEAMLQSSVHKLIFMSSISVYSDQKTLPWSENQLVRPTSLYGISKLVGEYLCKAYSEKGIESTIFRCAHVLGVEDKPYMIGNFLRSASTHKTIYVRGYSVAKREFIYVKDVARAILWAIENSVPGTFNLGTNQSYTNLEIAHCINCEFGNEGNLFYDCDKDEEIVDSYMDSGKIYKEGFYPEYSFNSAIKDIHLEWYT